MATAAELLEETSAESLSENRRSLELQKRAFRKVAQKNALERTAYTEEKRRIDVEKKNLKLMLEKEEKELKEQLGRLQEEKLQLYEYGTFEDLTLADDLSHCDLSADCQFALELSHSPTDITNPYPVAFPGRHQGNRSARAQELNQNPAPTRRSSGSSYNFDISPGKLPPIQGGNKLLYPSDITCSSVTQTDSSSSIKSTSPKDKREFWAGEPEAISSVRRARKTPREQRLEHNWVRSQSLKERNSRLRADSVSSLAQRSGLISRSQSMRESTKSTGSDLRRGLLLKSGSDRDASSKSPGIVGSIENLCEALAAIDPGTTTIFTRPRRAKSLKVKTTNKKALEVSLSPCPIACKQAWVSRENINEKPATVVPADTVQLKATGKHIDVPIPLPLPPISSDTKAIEGGDLVSVADGDCRDSERL